MIISLQNQKGGVGKTTLAVHIAHSLASRGSLVLLVDTDPQGSARGWAAARESQPPFTVVGLDRPTIHRDLPAIASNYDHVVIDGPPRVSDLVRSGVIAADLVVVPVSPFVINRKIVKTAIGRSVVEALSGYDIPVLRAQVCQRVAFAESAASGSTVVESNGNSQAAQEIAALVDELLEVGNAS